MKLSRPVVCLLCLATFAVVTPVLAVTDLPNPIGGGAFVSPQTIISNVIRAILALAGSMALLVFIYGGFNWVMSAGSEDKVQKGKDMMFWASVGLAVIFFSYTLVTTVINAVAGSGSGSSSQTNIPSSPGTNTPDGPGANIPNSPGT